MDNIGLKTTRVRSLSGEMLVFSNADLTKTRLRNFKQMQERRVVFKFGVTYATAPGQLEAIPGMLCARSRPACLRFGLIVAISSPLATRASTLKWCTGCSHPTTPPTWMRSRPPLRDGLNLAAKEFVAAKLGEPGVLLLSEFAGTAMELDDAVLVNPFSTNSLDETLDQSLDMPDEERRQRRQRRLAHVKEYDIKFWTQLGVDQFASL